MAKIMYNLKDIYDYLLKYYNIEWVGYMVFDNGVERTVQKKDFGGDNGKFESNLNVIAVVYHGSQRQNLWLNVSNRSFSIDVNTKPKISWQDFLVERYSQEQSL